MLRRVASWMLVLVGVGVVILGAGLALAHRAIRHERAPLPSAEAVLAVRRTDGPVRLSVINTASQAMPRAAVLDAGADPRGQESYVMGHPSFALEWADGAILLVDVGMNHDQAVAFGKPLQWLASAQPMQPRGSVAERLGADAKRVRGVVFTHLHTDHVGGISDLCERVGHPISVAMTPAQAERPNYTTRPGLKMVQDAPCLRVERLAPNGPVPVPGSPGVFVIPAGGHTPGSQIIVAFVNGPGGPRPYAFIGDIVNNIDGINGDIPKPFLYSLLMVPEDGERLSALRRYLRSLRDTNGMTLVVSHDQQQVDASGIPAWERRGG